MSAIRLIDPEFMVGFNRNVESVFRAVEHNLLELGASIKRGFAADAEQRRRDRDDELDWLGEWRGRRG